MTVRRVLYVIDSLGPGGAQRQLVTLVRAVDRSTLVPEVAYYHPIHHFRGELETGGVRIHDLGPAGGRDPRVVVRLARLLARERFDLAHAFLNTPGVLVRLAAVCAPDTRLVLSERGGGFGRSHVRLALDGALSRRADAMIVNASTIAKEVVSLVPAWKDRVHIVPNGIEWSEPTDADVAAGAAFRARSLGDAEFLLAAVGRVEREKAPDVLIDALARLPGHALDRLRVVWVGPRIDKSLARTVDAMLAAAGLGDRVSFLPETRDTRSVYLAADAVVTPSRWEGLPNVVLESLAHGTPVIATDVGDTALLIDAGRGGGTAAGRLVPPEDPAALSRAIEEFLDMPGEERSAMGAGGAEHVLREYSAEKLASRTLAVYEQVLAGGADGGAGFGRVRR